ncbi:hypothetical protein G7068_11260 [Leucobacter viscericola]|uniref:Uncharacterized protein n=1 Tax=Leucobacter viscericola TaxID=2714935 RepID=A0A6G7XGX6_9MICO|nr:hypothetical protein [Leucobacter viscericola]QIK63699.1 hypothetical protein G7068_11260 [Leucobacter viscericola]
MARDFRANFARKIIRADYHLDDTFLGGIANDSGDPSAKFYLKLDRAKRGKYITNRFLAVLLHGYSAFSFGLWAAVALGAVFKGDDIDVGVGIVTIAILLLGCLFLWFALRAISWLRWMVRNWRVTQVVPASGSKSKKKPRSTLGNDSIIGQTRLERPRAHPSDVLDIARTWFIQEFVRKHVKADYRPGDSLLIGYFPTSTNRAVIRWYPEEFIDGGKLWRLIMFILTLLPFMLAFWILCAVLSSLEYFFIPVNSYFYVIVISIMWSVVLGAQGFMRWMIRNWNTSRGKKLSKDQPTHEPTVRLRSQ